MLVYLTFDKKCANGVFHITQSALKHSRDETHRASYVLSVIAGTMENRDDNVTRPQDVQVFFAASLRFGAPQKIARAAGSKQVLINKA